MNQIMDIRFNVEKEERKALVQEVGEILGLAPIYMRAPSFAYTVGDYTIDRYGMLSFDEGVWLETQQLLGELMLRGYVCEGIVDSMVPSGSAPVEAMEEQPDGSDANALSSDVIIESEVVGEGVSTDEPTADLDATIAPSCDADVESSLVVEHELNLIIEVPIDGFTSTALDNLHRLVSGKAALIMKAIGADALPIKRTETTLRFPWFKLSATGAEADAYSIFVNALCEMAKKQKRVTLKEKSTDHDGSEKFAFRCFLLRLGFIGKEYSLARKVLLSNLSGSGSFKSGGHKNRRAADDTKIAHAIGGMLTGVVSNEEVEVTTNAADSTVPPRCQDCHHHCSHSNGELRTSTGEIVDTSRRTPDSYTHYCLGVPSGYRKLKHAVDWSGGETPPKWCPLANKKNESVSEDSSVEEIVSPLNRVVAV